MKVKYIRVSTVKQNTERQEITSNFPTYTDRISGTVKFTDRPEAQKLMQDIEKGKVNEVVVHSVDRLGRNTLDILNTIQTLKEKNIIVTIENFGLTSILPDGKTNKMFDFMVSIFATIAQQDRDNKIEAVQKGVEIAQKKGKYKGKRNKQAETPEKFLSKAVNKRIVKMLKKQIPIRVIANANDVNVSPSTVQKVKNIWLATSTPQPFVKIEVEQTVSETIGA